MIILDEAGRVTNWQILENKYVCPKCYGPLQQFIDLDSDDVPIKTTYICKKKFPGINRKGCGYNREDKGV